MKTNPPGLWATLLSILPPWGLLAGEPAAEWRQLFNGKDLDGWETYLAPPAGSRVPLGLNNDPRGVFTLAAVDGAPAIRVSGEIYGAVTTRDSFSNFHVR